MAAKKYWKNKPLLKETALSTVHYKSLENMYLSAPINTIFPPTITVSKGEAKITLDIQPEYFNAANSIHGAVYFKLLDDSAVFAASSHSEDWVVLTASFTTSISKPVTSGRVTAVGKIVKIEGRKLYAESVMYDEHENEVAKGHGLFLPCKMRFSDLDCYRV